MANLIKFPKNPPAPTKTFRESNPKPFLIEIDPWVIERIANTSVVQNAWFILNKLAHTPKGLKLTATGNLKTDFVREFFEYCSKSPTEKFFRPRTEGEFLELQRVRFLLTESGFIESDSKTLSITSEGLEVLSATHHLRLYLSLIEVATFGWNWGMGDRYDDMEFIQDNAMFFLKYMTHSPKPYVTAEEIFDVFFEEKPKRSKGQKTPSENDIYEEFFSPRGQAIGAIGVRFLNRFCIPFGLIEPLSDGFMAYTPSSFRFKKTKFLLEDFEKFVQEIPIEFSNS